MGVCRRHVYSVLAWKNKFMLHWNLKKILIFWSCEAADVTPQGRRKVQLSQMSMFQNKSFSHIIFESWLFRSVFARTAIKVHE